MASSSKTRSVRLLAALAFAGATTVAFAQDSPQPPGDGQACLFLQGHAEDVNSVTWSGVIFRSMVVEVDCEQKNYVVNLEVTTFAVAEDRSKPEVFDNAMAGLSDNLCATNWAELTNQGWVISLVTRAGDEFFRPTVVLECP